MKRNHFLPSLAKLFACGWLCAGMAAAETADRILSIDSHITVDPNRTMHVQEKFEIVNDGAFDSGFHRQRWIADASPNRWKPGSYESVTAKRAGRDAVPP